MASEPKHAETTQTAPIEAAAPCFTPQKRSIPAKTSQILFIRAGGRCEREGCNVRLFEHHLSKQPGNYADRSHIVAFSEKGSRGDDPTRPIDIHDVDNLMALCKPCHKEIDDHPERFSTGSLKAMKEKHERRVDALLDAAPDLGSHPISFTAPIRGFRVEIPRHDMFEAILPRYPHDGRETSIDLTALTGLSEENDLISVGRRMIDQSLVPAYGPGGPVEAAGRVSLFAIGPIPLLVYLGSRLGDKVPVDLYQRHRDTEDWTWKRQDTGKPPTYKMTCLEDRGEEAPVAILLSLSGKISPETVPDDVATGSTLYEIELAGVSPSPTFLSTADDLAAFRLFWHDAQSEIAAKHGDNKPLKLMPAVPAPIAVSLGKDRLPKARAPLHIYDNDVTKGGFTFQLEIT